MCLKKSIPLLILILLIATSCRPDHTFSFSTSQPNSQGDLAETSLQVPSPTPAPVPSGYHSPHPWDQPDVFFQQVSSTNRIPIGFIPEASIYHIALQIPENLSEPLTGKQAVRYVNREGIPLDEIYFRLFPNFHGGELEVENLRVDGKLAAVMLENQETALRLALDAPLQPGESLVITLDFVLQLPVEMGGNYGLFGYFDEILVLDTFYPSLPAHDQNGWYIHYPYPNGDNTYQDASYYLVEISAPKTFLFAATGSPIIEMETEDSKQVIYAAGPARDFYLGGSRAFTVLSSEVDGIQINSYALPEYETHQEKALLFAANALNSFNDLFGPYPYTEFDLISSPMRALGIEYPGITGIWKDLYEVEGKVYGVENLIMLETVIVHEVGHQWFYNVVGNDQQDHPWLDESLVQFITYLHFVEDQQESLANGLVSNWQSRLAMVEEQEKPIGLPGNRYRGLEYSGIVYGRGPLFFQNLEKQLGRATLLEAIRDYYQDNQWDIATEEDIRNSLEEACRCDLSKTFEEWIYTGGFSEN